MRELLFAIGLGALAACSQATWPERDPRVVQDVGVDSLRFWPPGMRHIPAGDSAWVRVLGLRRGFLCARVTDLRLESESGPDSAALRPRNTVEIPGDGACALDARGLDTALRVRLDFGPGTLLRLRGVAGGDSALLVEAESAEDSLVYLRDSAGIGISGRFVFRDSVAGRPFRTLGSDSLAACETLQYAAFARRGDTLRVRFRVLRLDPTRHGGLAPCAGPHADSVTAVPAAAF